LKRPRILAALAVQQQAKCCALFSMRSRRDDNA